MTILCRTEISGMANFKPLNRTAIAPKTKPLPPEVRYWRDGFQSSVVQLNDAISHLASSPTAASEFAVAVGRRLAIFDDADNKRTFSQFKEPVRCVGYRADGQLLVAAGEDRFVRVFAEKTMLRAIAGHRACVRCCGFSVVEPTQVFSGSDDCQVRLCNVAEESTVAVWDSMGSAVHSCTTLPGQNRFFAGLRNGRICCLDPSSGSEAVMEASHSDRLNAVDCLTVSPHGGGYLLFSAGGCFVKLWDLRRFDQPIDVFSDHYKPVSALALSSCGQYLTSAAFDHTVRVYELSASKLICTLRYPSPLSAVTLSTAGQRLFVAGTVDGMLVVKQRRQMATNAVGRRMAAKRRHQTDGAASQPSKQSNFFAMRIQPKLAGYEKALRKFNSAAALDCLMRSGTLKFDVGTAVHLIRDLIHRDGLGPALSNRNERFLVQLTDFIVENLAVPQFTDTLTCLAELLLHEYGHRLSDMPKLCSRLQRLRASVRLVVEAEAESSRTVAMLQTVLRGADGVRSMGSVGVVGLPAVECFSLADGNRTGHDVDAVGFH